MQVSARGSATFRTVAALTLAVTAGGCATWTAATSSPGEVVAQKDRIRVTRLDSSRVVLSQPALEGESLVGLVVQPCESRHSSGVLVERSCSVTESVPLADVFLLEVSRVQAGRTAGVLLLIPVGVLGFGFAMCAAFCEYSF